MTLAPNLVITNQSIGDATSSYYLSLFDFDGFIGFGPKDLTNGTLSPDTNSTIPTILDNLVSQGLIEKPVFSLYFSPSENDSDTSEYAMLDPYVSPSLRCVDGVMTYGGYDQSLVWTRFSSASCRDGSYALHIVRGRADVCSLNGNISGLSLLGH